MSTVYSVKSQNEGGGGIKSGNVVVEDGSYQDVVFGTAFQDAPEVTVSPVQTSPDAVISISNVTASGFRVYLTSGEASLTLHWIATDVGNS